MTDIDHVTQGRDEAKYLDLLAVVLYYSQEFPSHGRRPTAEGPCDRTPPKTC